MPFGHPWGYPIYRRQRYDLGRETQEFIGMLLGDPCSYCGRRPLSSRTEAVDHIEPRTTGGPGQDTWDNLTMACHRCNSIKGSHSLLWMVARMGADEVWRRGQRTSRRGGE